MLYSSPLRFDKDSKTDQIPDFTEGVPFLLYLLVDAIDMLRSTVDIGENIPFFEFSANLFNHLITVCLSLSEFLVQKVGNFSVFDW